jgi:hypothetical protein
MTIKINLFFGALALITTTGAFAYDYGTKATAMQNNDKWSTSAPQVVQNWGPTEKHYDKASVASINRDADLRRSEAATDFRRTRGIESYAIPIRSSAYKPTYYSTHSQ